MSSLGSDSGVQLKGMLEKLELIYIYIYIHTPPHTCYKYRIRVSKICVAYNKAL